MKPRVIVATAHTSNYQELADVTRPTIERYCAKWGYDFYYEPAWETRFPNDGDRMKARIYEELYAKNELFKTWDVFVWIDTDALIMRSEIDVDAILSMCGADDHDHFVWGYDVGGPNSGVYFARFTPQAHAFMHTQFSRSIEMGWGDQSAMIQVSLVKPYVDWIKCVPGYLFNAYLLHLYGWERYPFINGYQEGYSVIVHLPGIPQERRIPIARELAAKAT